ncbi:hypothetical protein A2U01_0111712, partial [Trifolium medium]|nr:hypothetical protein [Trifolium medium]
MALQVTVVKKVVVGERRRVEDYVGEER